MGGDWGSDEWCDLNMSGYSPHYPAPVDADPANHGPGGEGSVFCSSELRGTKSPGSLGAGDWPDKIKGLYNVVDDPREMHDLQSQRLDLVAELHSRLKFWQSTTVPSIHP